MKRIICLIMALVLCISAFSGLSSTAYAANTTSPWAYSSTPTRAIYYKSPVMTGNDVKWVQQALNITINANLVVDGSFGPASKKAVIQFQRRYGLTQDGSFGPASRAKMVSVLNGMGYYENVNTSALTVEQVKRQITNTYAAALRASGRSSFSGMCGLYVRYQLSVLGLTNYSQDTDCSGNGNKFVGNIKAGVTSTGFTKTKESGGRYCVANIVSEYGGANLYNIVISYPHQYGYTNSNPGAGHVVFIHAIINNTVYYSDNYKVGNVNEGGVLTKSVTAFDTAYSNSYGNAVGAVWFHK